MSPQAFVNHHPKCRRRRSIRRKQRLGRVEAAVGCVVIGFLMHHKALAQSAPTARWGQATAMIDNVMYIHGGKVDPTNSFSYTSAPNTNDLYALSLSSSFSVSDPPWTYLSGSQNASTSQGPAVAFHTLTPYSDSQFLLFGGDGGPGLPIETNNDSAWTVTVCQTCQTTWTQEPANWASEPMRQMYQSAATTGSEVWITGGQKADGSGLGFQDTYTFNGQTFIQSSPLPLDLVGHRSVILPSGLLVVLGGYSPSLAILNSLSTMYFLDTTSTNPTWGNITLQGQTPSPRRNFALALLDGNKLLIHGGGDGTLQNLYPDGAILDMSLSPISWVTAPALASSLGARVDHTAVGVGTDVLFGFGRGADGPAPGNVLVYNAATGSFVNSFSPSSSSSSSGGSGSAIPALPTGTQGFSTGVNWPSTRVTGAIPGQSTAPIQPNPNGGGAADGDGHGGGHQETAAIALGTIFGILGSLALGFVVVVFCLRRRQTGSVFSSDRHRLIGSSRDPTDPENPISAGSRSHRIPVVHGAWEDIAPARKLFGVPIPFTRQINSRERIDMLHDEDARSFSHSRRGTGQSAILVRPTFRRMGSSSRNLWDGVWNASSASLRAAGSAFGLGGSPGPTPTVERSSPDWWEKKKDPFADDAVALANVPSVTAVGMGLANRQRGGQIGSFSSTSTTYHDPFRDSSIGSHSRFSTMSGQLYGDLPLAEPWQPFVVPASDAPGNRPSFSPPLSPTPEELGGLAEPVLLNSLSSKSFGSSDPAQFTPSSELTHGSSSSGAQRDQSSAATSPPPVSLIGAAPASLVKRSDSWWNRFGRASLSSIGSRSPGPISPIRRLSLRNTKDGYTNIDFRDPNPPPSRLEDIKESGKSNEPSPQTPQSQRQKRAQEKQPSTSKSVASFQTADSEMLEKIAVGKMDVVQRGSGRQASSETTTPAGSIYEDWELGQARLVSVGSPQSTERPPMQEKTSSSSNATGRKSGRSSLTPTSESYATAASRPPAAPHDSDESFKTALTSIPPPPKAPPKRKLTSGIATRIAQFENIAENAVPSTASSGLPKSPTQLNIPKSPVLGSTPVVSSPTQMDPPASPKSPTTQERRSRVQYGLQERPSLFVANPDRGSGNSNTSID